MLLTAFIMSSVKPAVSSLTCVTCLTMEKVSDLEIAGPCCPVCYAYIEGRVCKPSDGNIYDIGVAGDCNGRVIGVTSKRLIYYERGCLGDIAVLELLYRGEGGELILKAKIAAGPCCST